MWQRIQTLYLALIALITGLIIFAKLPLAILKPYHEELASSFTSFGFSDGRYTLDDHLVLLLLCVLVLIFSIVVIFLFRYRKLQKMLSIALIFINLIAAILAFYLVYREVQLIGELYPVKYLPGWGGLGILLCILLASLAKRGIEQDEKLVKSMDRLR